MRALIVGTGLIAHNHAMALRQQGHVLHGVVSRRAENAMQFAGQYGCGVFGDTLTPEMLSDVDAVHICTPPGEHFAYAKMALEAGKAVFCEKPLTFSSREAEELCRLAEERGLLAAVNFNNRFYPACTILRAQAAESGAVELIHGHYRQEFQMMPAPWSWRYTDPYRAISEIGSHFVDLMRYLSGKEVESLSAMCHTVEPQRCVREGMMERGGEGEAVTVTNEDAVSVTFRLAGGGMASAFFSEINPGRSNDLAIELVTMNGSFGWCSEDPYAVTVGRKGQGMARQANAFGGGFSTTFGDAIAAFYASLASGVKDERLAAFRDGLAAVKLCEAMKESAARGGMPVTL